MAKRDDRTICPRMFEPSGWKDACFRCGSKKKVSINYQLNNLVCDACRAVFKTWSRPEYLAYEKQIREQERRKAYAREQRRRAELTPEARAAEDRDNRLVNQMFGSVFFTR